MAIKEFSVTVAFVVLISQFATCDQSTASRSLFWLNEQNSKISALQTNTVDQLNLKGVPIGGTNAGSEHSTSTKTQIGLSTSKLPLQCRYSLTSIPTGQKAIAPCACSGSQKVIMHVFIILF